MSININTTNNTVSVTNTNQNITVVDNNKNTTAVVSQPITNIVQVTTLGPQGPKGEPGLSPEGSAFATTGSNVFIGNQTITGSLNVTSGITGSLLGSASYALTASYALNAGGGGSIYTGSFATTGSNRFNGDQTITGSIYLRTGSVIESTITGDINIQAGTALGSVVLWDSLRNHYIAVDQSGSYIDDLRVDGFLHSSDFTGTGSLLGTASYALNSISASYATNTNNAATASYVLNAISASYAATSSYADNFTVAGTITAQKLVVQTVTSSVIYSSGSNIFGNSLANTHQFTGSVYITGSGTINGNLNITKPYSVVWGTNQQINVADYPSYYSAGYNVMSFINSSDGTYPDNGSFIWRNAALSTNLMALNGLGNLGIGTAFPTSRLHIKGATSSSISSSLLIQNSNLSSSLIVQDNGFVGIGTASPSASLHVGASTGTIQIGANTNANIAATAAGGLTLSANIGSGNPVSINNQYQFYYQQLQGNGSAYFTDWLSAGASTRAGLSTLSVNKVVTATSGSGLVSIGNGPWDNTTTGFFTGSSYGTMLAINASASYIGNILDFQTTGSSKLVLTGTGNVGIGTAAPAYTLDVSGSGRFTNGLTHTGSLLHSGSSTFNGGNYVFKAVSTGDGGIQFDNSINGYTSLNWTSNAVGFGLIASGGIMAKVNAGLGLNVSNVVTSTSYGAMLGVRGSGATSASKALLVQNSSAASSLTVYDDGTVQAGNSLFLNSTTPFNISPPFSVTDQITGIIAPSYETQWGHYIGSTRNGGTGDTSLALFGLGTGGGYYGGIRFFTSANSRTPVLAMIVDRNQSVGIGLTNSTSLTVNTSAQLQVDSTIKGFLPPRTNLTSNISNPAQGLMTYLTGSTNEGLYVYNSGSNIGWQRLLTDTGSLNLSGSISITGDITGSNALFSGTITAQKLVVQTVTSSVIYSSGSNIFGNDLNNTQIFTGSLYQTGSLAYFAGSVSIGTTGSAYKLNIPGNNYIQFSGVSAQNAPAYIGTDSSDNFYIYSAGQGLGKSTYLGPSNGTYVRTNSSLIQLATGNGTPVERMRIDSTTGYVGIGTTLLSASLHIKGATTSSLSSSLLIQNSNLSASFAVLDNSYVGIGNAAPTVPLEIGQSAGGTQAKLRLWSGASQWAQLEGGDSTLDINTGGNYAAVITRNGGYRIVTPANSLYGFAAANGGSSPVGTPDTSIFRLSAGKIAIGTGLTGNASGSLVASSIGVGTLNPSASLHVVGATSSSLSSSLLVQNINLSSSFVVLDNGYVGVGTASPNYSLTVNAPVAGNGVAAYVGSAGIVITGNAGSGNPGIQVTTGVLHINATVNGTGGGEILNVNKSANGANIQQWRSFNSTILTVVSGNGSIGIGTATPSASLHVSGAILVDQALLLNQTSSSLASGTRVVASSLTGSYVSAFYNYTLASASNARSGQVMVVWNGGSIQYTDNSTLDIGSTANVVFTASLSGSNINLSTVFPSSTWTVKTLANFL